MSMIKTKGDLVTITRNEYEEFLEFKKAKEFTPTAPQKRALTKAEENFRRGKTLSYGELASKLGFADR